MRIKDTNADFQKMYSKRYNELKKAGLVQPRLSSIAKQYALLDFQVKYHDDPIIGKKFVDCDCSWVKTVCN